MNINFGENLGEITFVWLDHVVMVFDMMILFLLSENFVILLMMGLMFFSFCRFIDRKEQGSRVVLLLSNGSEVSEWEQIEPRNN